MNTSHYGRMATAGGFAAVLLALAACNPQTTKGAEEGPAASVQEAAVSADSVPGQLAHLCNINSLPENPDSELVGAFDGKWDGVMDHTIVITSVTGDRVEAYYAWGAYEPWGVTRADCDRKRGRIRDDGTIKFQLRSADNATVVYRLVGDDHLVGTIQSDGGVSQGTFKRVSASNSTPTG